MNFALLGVVNAETVGVKTVLVVPQQRHIAGPDTGEVALFGDALGGGFRVFAGGDLGQQLVDAGQLDGGGLFRLSFEELAGLLDQFGRGAWEGRQVGQWGCGGHSSTSWGRACGASIQFSTGKRRLPVYVNAG